MTGKKFDTDKTRISLLLDFSKSLEAVAELAEFGAEKYVAGSWKLVPKGEKRYTDAMLRHLFAEQDSLRDDESEMLHATAVAFNALARLHFVLEHDPNRLIPNIDENEA